jgi:hypothetical protein
VTTLVPLVRKEVRALLPLWLVVMAAIWLSPAVSRQMGAGAFLFYILGPAMLGAFAVGHEDSYRTLGSLLTQPIRRSTLFAIKLAVLGAMLIAVWAVAWITFDGFRPPAEVFVLPVLGGLLAVPFMTMATRNQMAGVVFPLAIAGGWFAVLDFASPVFGSDPQEASRVALLWWSRGLIAFAMVTGMLGWRRFMRMEAIEGQGLELQLPAWGAKTAEARAFGPVWPLVRKELRLQQMTFALILLYVPLFIVIIANSFDGQAVDALGAATAMFALGVALLAGSLASAEERQLGVMEVQRLMPLGAWRQWVIKVLVTFAVALFVGVMVPVVLAVLAEPANLAMITAERVQLALIAIAVISSVSLWVSSLMNSPTRALAVSFLACATLSMLLGRVGVFLIGNGGVWNDEPLLWAVGAISILLLAFGGINHQSMEHRPKRAVVQAVAAAALVPLSVSPQLLSVFLR